MDARDAASIYIYIFTCKILSERKQCASKKNSSKLEQKTIKNEISHVRTIADNLAKALTPVCSRYSLDLVELYIPYIVTLFNLLCTFYIHSMYVSNYIYV